MNQALRDLSRGELDVLVGINLLREGLDLPEVSLVAILDADKEGFLRSQLANPNHRARRAQRGRACNLVCGRHDRSLCRMPSARRTGGASGRCVITRKMVLRRKRS